MLVNYIEPLGIINLERKRIHGMATKYKPYDVDYDFYKRHEGHLVHGTYREDYLRKHFRGPFPEIAFRMHELKHLPRRTLTTLAHGMTIHVSNHDSHNAIVKRIQARLRVCYDH